MTLALAALLAAAALALAGPATAATPTGASSSAPAAATSSAPAAPPTVTATPETVRVVRLPDRIGPEDLTALSRDLAGESGAVVVVPEGAELTGDVPVAALQRLDAAKGLTVVLAPGGPGGDAARVLAAVADKAYALPDAALAAPHDAALWAQIQALRSCPRCPLQPQAVANADAVGTATGTTFERHDLPSASMASVLGPLGTAGDGDGVPIWLLLVLALAAILLALGARALLGRRERGGGGAGAALPAAPSRSPRPLTSSPPPPAPAAHRVARHLPDVRLPGAGEAIVRSELQPDGYVELDRCLRRARWADARRPPPPAGEPVHVETDRGGVLVARAAR